MKKLITISALMFVFTISKSQTTINIEPPIDDAFVYQATPSTNYGNSNNLDVGQGPSGELRMLIKWDLSSLPSCINISNAQIRLNQWSNNNNIGVDILRINGSWDEASVTWNNQPVTTGWYGTQTFSSSGSLYFIPATDLVNDLLAYGNNGVMFIMSWGSNSQSFESGEASGSDPRLIITYTLASPPSATISSTDENCGNCDGTATANVSGGATPYNYSWSNGQTTSTATGLCSGTYTVTITDDNGCNDIATTTINNISGLSVSVSSTQDETCGTSNGEICVNATNGTTPYTHLWSDSQISSCATGLSSGTYTVTVTDANGCTDNSNGAISNSGQLPTAQFTASQTTINEGDCINFTDQSSGNPTSWSWTFTGGNPISSTLQNPNNVCYNSAGTYQVSLTVSNSCGQDTESKSNYIKVNSVIGISDFETNSIKVLPNPVSDKLIVESFETANVVLFNALGKRVYEDDFAKRIEIDFSKYSEGVYFLEVEMDEGTARKKIFVVR